MSINPVSPEFGDRILTLVEQGGLPGVPAGNARINLLGNGETYAAWAIRPAGEAFTLRVVNRPVCEMPRSMHEEFAALRLVPEGVGTQGVAMDADPGNPLGRPWMLTTFVPGQVKAASDWTAADLEHVAKVAARLHQRTSPRCGAVTDPEGERLDIVDDFATAWAWWCDAEPELTREPPVVALHDGIVAALHERADAFDGLEFAHIHGDLVVTNVVFDGDSPGFVDWEWSEYGDPAKDLGHVGGGVHGGPWTVPLTDAQVDDFLAAYVSASRHLGSDVDPVPLRRRRDCWELHERFLSSLHYVTKSRHPGAAPFYAAAVASIRAGLERRLNTLAQS